ncbi:MAG: 1-acyl-sn-glycerol-3-phosphate acyltransferase [Myxococcales bacterium]|nr:1-acyl-sn-glycerol-3-phosphate acyltransferase [Myxococcales bacterium]
MPSNGLLEKAKSVAWSTWAWGSSVSWMVFNGATTMMALPILDTRRSQYFWMQPGMALCVRLTGAKLNVIHHPDFDPARRSVFCQNHVSVIDAHIACATIPHHFCGIMNHWHFNVPGYGWIMKLANGIPVFPKKSGRTAEMTDAARDRVRRGISILAFPEAHRTLDGKIREFKRGVFFMARDAGIPVVPLAVRGIYELNHKGTNLFNRGTEVDVFIGPQFETKGLSDDELDRVIAEVRQMMIDWVEDGRLPNDCPHERHEVPAWPLPSHYWQISEP